MSQFRTLLWLKWILFRNSLRSRKAKVSQAASILGTIITLGFALVVAITLGIVAYAITAESSSLDLTNIRSSIIASAEMPPAYYVFFMIFSFLYLLWVTLPLSIGGGNQFDPSRLLMYPISLPKLFLLDLVSEFVSLSSLFAIPAIVAMTIGAGLGSGTRGSLLKAIVVTVPAIAFGIALAKWLATSIGALMQKRRSGGETLLALIGVSVALGGALIGQLMPFFIQHYRSFSWVRWTPPGAAALALIQGLGRDGTPAYIVGLLILVIYTIPLVLATYWIAKRRVLGRGERRRRVGPKVAATVEYTGWEIPLLPNDLVAVIEKEFRYAVRNVQLRMMALMPLILIVIRFMNSRQLGRGRRMPNSSLFPGTAASEFGQALLVTAGVLYVFLILAGLACNQFAFEEGGMKTLILAPIQRRKILIGKNVVVTIMALLYSTVLLILNEIAFRDLTPRILLFVALSFVVFNITMLLAGNWFSIQFPKRMKFGKRMNLSGMAGLLVIPILLLMTLPPVIATVAVYFAESSLVGYATLALFAVLALALYLPIVTLQGRSLARHEQEILQVVGKEADV